MTRPPPPPSPSLACIARRSACFLFLSTPEYARQFADPLFDPVLPFRLVFLDALGLFVLRFSLEPGHCVGELAMDEVHRERRREDRGCKIRPPDIALSGDERFVPLNSQSEAELGAGKGNGECIELCAQCRERRGAMWRRLAGDGYA